MPVVLASLPLVLGAMRDTEYSKIALGLASMAIAFGCAAIPSLASTLIMERAFSRGLHPEDKKAVLFWSFLGLLSGSAVSLIVMGGNKFLFVAALGCAAWTITGLVILFLARSAKKTEPIQRGTDNDGAAPHRV